LLELKTKEQIINILQDYVDNIDMTFRERFIDKALRKNSNFNVKTNIRKTIFIHNHKDGILEYIFKINKEEYIFKSNSIPISYNSNIVFIGILWIVK